MGQRLSLILSPIGGKRQNDKKRETKAWDVVMTLCFLGRFIKANLEGRNIRGLVTLRRLAPIFQGFTSSRLMPHYFGCSALRKRHDVDQLSKIELNLEQVLLTSPLP